MYHALPTLSAADGNEDEEEDGGSHSFTSSMSNGNSMHNTDYRKHSFIFAYKQRNDIRMQCAAHVCRLFMQSVDAIIWKSVDRNANYQF